MRRFGVILLLLLPLFPGFGRAAGQDPPVLLFWNLENFFDPRPDSTSVSELEFSAFGSRRWTRKRFDRKAGLIAKTLLWAGDRAGRLPDAAGFAELENRRVLQALSRGPVLRKAGYRAVHFDSPDPRGIDVGLLYREPSLKLMRASPVRIRDSLGRQIPTRDLLLAEFRMGGGDSLAVLVCHFPSKYGGADASAPRREAAVARLESVTDSLRGRGWRRIVAMGDFNDTPDQIRPRGLVNLSLPLFRLGAGTIRYEGTWELIDMFFVPEDVPDPGRMEILHPPFLTVPDRANGGSRPLRTWSGPRYLGGVSDHRPILLLPSDLPPVHENRENLGDIRKE